MPDSPENKCIACGGTGVIRHAKPSCSFKAAFGGDGTIPPEYELIEACDLCVRFTVDFDAAETLSPLAHWIKCDDDGYHAIIPTQALSPTTQPEKA